MDSLFSDLYKLKVDTRYFRADHLVA